MSERQRVDLERRQTAEEAFEHSYNRWKNGLASWVNYAPKDLEAIESDWATIASEMGLTDFYKRLKEGK